jgi:signal transduction histidine kinase
VVEFQASALAPLTWTGVAVAAVAVLLASLLGIRVGRAFANDLTATTARVRRLRTDGPGRLNFDSAPPARYAQVAALDGAIDTLAARFRVFASAQEMAIEARAAGRRMRTLLFASVSHDLRNPLNAILGFAELVSRKPLTLAQRESLGFIQQSGRELLALIIVILDMAKVEAQRVTLDRDSFHFAVAVNEAVRRGTALVSDPVDVDVGVADEVGRVFADRERIVQAISLLVTHCVRTASTARSTGTAPRPIPVTASRDRAGKRVVVRIADPNGAIPRADLERLLTSEPWVAERRRYGGLTLGLALARLLVERHGGTLQVIGEPAETEFDLVLPSEQGDDSVHS